MAGNEFGRSRAVSQAGISAASFRQGSMMTGKMPVTPSRESFSPSGRNANPSAVRNAAPASQHFFTGGARTNAGMNGANNGASNGARNQSSFEGNRNAGNPCRSEIESHQRGGCAVEPKRMAYFYAAQSANTSHSAQASSKIAGARLATHRQLGNSNRETYLRPRGNPRAFTGGSEQLAALHPADSPAQTQQVERGGSTQTQQYNRGGYSAPQQQNERGSFPQSQQQYSRGQAQQPQYQRGGYPQPRQQLNMRQPVVTPRQNYSAPRPSYSAPRGNSGGGGSAHGGGGGGGHSSGHSR